MPKLTGAARRRSSSLTGTARDSTASLLEQQQEEAITLSKSAPSSPVPSHCEREKSEVSDCKKKLSFCDTNSALKEEEEKESLLSTATPAKQTTSQVRSSELPHPNGYTKTNSDPLSQQDEEVDWAGHSENSLADHDSGLYSSSSHRSASLPKSSSLNSLNIIERGRLEGEGEGERCSSAAATGSDVELKDIYFKLKRKSQSYESLLDAYTEEDTGLRNVLHSTLKELARLSANLDGDSVFSDDDDELGENDTSSINLDLTIESDYTSETSLHHSSLNTSSSSCLLVQELRAALNSGAETTAVCGNESAAQRQRPPLLRAQSELTSLETKLREIDELVTPQELGEDGEDQLQSSSEVLESEEKESKKKRPVRRSLSYNNSGITKAVLKRRRRKKSSACEEQLTSSEQEKSKEPPSPSEMLNQFKIASLGCSVGLESKSALRSLICDTQPNTEKDNYKLSVDREP